MGRKVIFFDIDGTLTDARSGVIVPSNKTKTIIQKMLQANHVPVIATGRPLCMIDQDIKNLGFNSYITSAGGYVTIKDKVIVDVPIPGNMVQKLFDFAIANNIFVFTENSECIFIHPTQKEHWYTFFVKRGVLKEEKIVCETNFINKKNYKLFVRWKNNNQFQLLVETFKNEFKFGAFTCPDGMHGSDVIYKTHSKAVGIHKVLDYLQVAPEDSFAVGDGANDMEMFASVGCSIAMGNAVKELKEIATVVTDSVKEEGIYNYFNTMAWLDKEKVL